MTLLDLIGLDEFNARLSEYESDGAVCLRDVFTKDDVAALQATYSAAAASCSDHLEVCEEAVDGASPRFYIDSGLIRFRPFEQFLLGSVAAEIAGRFMRSTRVRYFVDQLIVKEPGSCKPTPWHQDQPYYPLKGRQLCSLWVPIDPVGRNTGVLFVAESHSWVAHSPRSFGSGEDFGTADMPRLPEFGAPFDNTRILAFDMEPGDCLVFDSMTVHGAPGNATSAIRRAFSIRFAGDDVRHRHRVFSKSGRTFGQPGRDGQSLDDDEYPVLWISPTR